LREESRFQKQENLCNYMYKTLQRENWQNELWQDSKKKELEYTS
jgi:hypothetical protein